MLYLFIIGGSMLLIALLNILYALPAFADGGYIWVAISTLLGTVSVIAWDGIQAFLIRRLLPERMFSPSASPFTVSKRERAFYRKLHVNEWKDLIPELGGFTNFHKSEFSSPSDAIYLARFLLESNYGVAIHLANAALGFLILLLPWCSEPAIGLPIALVNLVLSLLPVIILRFNTAPLRNLYLRSIKKASASNEP
jgi:hypothetical protein